VSKEVAYLITDSPDSGSSKNLAAQKLGVKVISEEDFRKNNF
jgi:NAD-dependent DNA ligase